MKKTLQSMRTGILILLFFGMKTAIAGCGNPAPSLSVTSLGFQQYQFFCSYKSYTSIKWLFGNGATSANYNIKYTYPSEGKYVVKLVQYDSSKSCYDTFTYGTLCVLTSNYFVSKSTGVYRYLFISANKDTTHRRFNWDYGNGYSGTGSVKYYKYGYKDTYATSLTVYDSVLGCSSKTNISVIAQRCNTVDSFKLFGSCSINKYGSLTYKNGFNNGKLNASIMWGDFSTDTVMNRINAFGKSHNYSTAGIKTVTILLTDTASCQDTMVRKINVWDTGFSNIHFNFNSSLAGSVLTYSISDSMAKKYFEYVDFGDGGKSTGLSGTHTYSKGNNTYKLCARFVSKDALACINTICKNLYIPMSKCGMSVPSVSINSYNPGKLTYNFSASIRFGYKPKWFFGNGSTGASWNMNYSYPADGKYDVKLVLTDSSNTCSDTFGIKTLCVLNTDYTITKNSALTYDFIASDTVRSKRTYSWDFGNSTSGNGKKASTTYGTTYGMPDTYETKLTLYDSVFGCSASTSKFATVKGCSGVDTFKFTNDCNTNKSGTLLYQNNTKYWYGLTAKIIWGDGSSDTISGNGTLSKSHVYSKTGSNYIHLIVKDSSSCVDSLYRLYNMTDTAFNNRYFGYSFSQSGRNISASVVNSFAKSHFAYWEMGDGNTVYGTSNKYTYANVTKTYNLCAFYKSFDNANCTQKSCISVSVSIPKCSAGFTKYGDTTKKFSMYVVNVSTGKRFHWDFGDGDTSSSYTPKHTYTGLGPYNLCITAYDSACSSTYCDTIGFDTSGVMNRSAGFTITVVDANGNSNAVKDLAKANEIKVYPNPSAGVLHISGLNPSQQGVLEMYTAQGKKVAEFNLGYATKAMVDVSGIADGWYIVKIRSGAVYATPVPVIIQH